MIIACLILIELEGIKNYEYALRCLMELEGPSCIFNKKSVKLSKIIRGPIRPLEEKN